MQDHNVRPEIHSRKKGPAKKAKPAPTIKDLLTEAAAPVKVIGGFPIVPLLDTPPLPLPAPEPWPWS